jgi:ubiquitin conjugation factor E4 B
MGKLKNASHAPRQARRRNNVPFRILTIYRREPNLATDSLTPYLLNEAGEDKGVCPDFITEAVARFGDDDMARSMITKSVAGLSYQLSNLTMNDSYKPYINVSSLPLFNFPIALATYQANFIFNRH